jgi:hypothetical protein
MVENSVVSEITAYPALIYFRVIRVIRVSLLLPFMRQLRNRFQKANAGLNPQKLPVFAPGGFRQAGVALTCTGTWTEAITP